MNAPARTPTISASAIESFDPALGGCARKWAFSRLDGVPKPQSPGAALGSRCHELWESYLRDGTPFDLSTPEGRICDATRHLLPPPGHVDVETSFRFEWEGVAWAGKKDAVYWERKGGTVDERFIVGDDKTFRVVLDHKTTSDFLYAKSDRASLLGHPQAPIYALEEHEMIAERAPVMLAWNYVKHNVTFDKNAPPNERGYTIKRAGRPVALEPPVRLIVGRAEAEDALGKHVPTAKRMLAIIAEPPAPHECVLTGDKYIAKQLEPNPDACDAFGGCPYRSQCGLTPQDIAARMTRLFAAPEGAGEQKNMSSALRDRIAAIKADRAGNGPAQSTAVGVQQAIEAEAAAKVARVANALEAGAQVVGASGTIQGKTLDEIAQRTAVYGPVNPPEGSHAVVGDVEPLAENFTASGQAQPLPPAEAPTQPDAPAAKRRGRPPGSKNKVKGAPNPQQEEIDAWAKSLAEEARRAEDFDLQAGGSTLPDGTKLDTIPAPPIGDADAARRVLRLLATTLLRALNEENAL